MSEATKSSDPMPETPAGYTPAVRSGSYAEIGSRQFMEDEHICVDDLSTDFSHNFNLPTSFYALFDGHAGSSAAIYLKENAIKFFFIDADLPKSTPQDAIFLEELADCHRKAFHNADIALSTESSVSNICGTTVLTALVIGRHLMVANAGDCRAVLCKKGTAVNLSNDHRPSYTPERRRVEECGGFIDDMGYLGGELSVTRALGDWHMKPSALISDPEVQHFVLSEEDEFMIIGCDGIWDVVPSQAAVSLVRRGLRRHKDPEQSAKELAKEAARLLSSDNLTVIVVSFTTVAPCEPLPSKRSPTISTEGFQILKGFLE